MVYIHRWWEHIHLFSHSTVFNLCVPLKVKHFSQSDLKQSGALPPTVLCRTNRGYSQNICKLPTGEPRTLFWLLKSGYEWSFWHINHYGSDLFFWMTSLVLELLSVHLEDPNINDISWRERSVLCGHYLFPAALYKTVLIINTPPHSLWQQILEIWTQLMLSLQLFGTTFHSL